jgi:Holliday junction resolvase RusA-like endonuclease
LKILKFDVPGEVRGKGRPRASSRGGFVKLYTDAKTASYENLVSLVASRALDGRTPFTGPLEVFIDVRITPPASCSKKRRQALLDGREAIYGKFDLDNQVKAILDGCNKIAFVDDKQIVRLYAEKIAAESPGATVEIRERDDEIG